MLTRFHKILIGVLVAQIALAVILMTRGDSTAALAEKPLLANFDPAKVTRVQVFAPNQTKPIDLVKRGNDWVLASHFNYPVLANKVTDMLTPLPKLAAAEPMATQASRHKQLKVGDVEFERKLVISAGGPDITLYVGTSAGGRRTPVRIGSDARVYGVSGLQAFSIFTDPNQWVDTAYVNVPVDDVVKLTVQRGANKVELERVAAAAAGAGSAGSAGSGSARGSAGSAGSGSGSAATAPAWKVLIDGAAPTLAAGESIDTDGIDKLLTKVAQLHLSAPGDPKRDASHPTATITLARKTGTPIVLDAVVEGETYWVAERGRGKAALISKPLLDDVVTLARDKLVKKPAPKGTGSGSGSDSGSDAPDPTMVPGLDPNEPPLPMPPMQ